MTAAAAMRSARDVILPFPGGIVRSGSKVGSRYKGLIASTNDAYCPTLRPLVASALPQLRRGMTMCIITGSTERAWVRGLAALRRRLGRAVAHDDGVGRDALQASVMTFRTDALIAKPAWNVFEEDAVGHPPRRMLWVGEGIEVDHRGSGC